MAQSSDILSLPCPPPYLWQGQKDNPQCAELLLNPEAGSHLTDFNNGFGPSPRFIHYLEQLGTHGNGSGLLTRMLDLVESVGKLDCAFTFRACYPASGASTFAQQHRLLCNHLVETVRLLPTWSRGGFGFAYAGKRVQADVCCLLPSAIDASASLEGGPAPRAHPGQPDEHTVRYEGAATSACIRNGRELILSAMWGVANRLGRGNELDELMHQVRTHSNIVPLPSRLRYPSPQCVTPFFPISPLRFGYPSPEQLLALLAPLVEELESSNPPPERPSGRPQFLVVNLGANDGECGRGGLLHNWHYDPANCLLENPGVGGVLVEGDPRLFQILRRKYQRRPWVHLHLGMISPETALSSIAPHVKRLGALVARARTDNLVLLKIDVDNCDLDFAEALLLPQAHGSPTPMLRPWMLHMEISYHFPPPVEVRCCDPKGLSRRGGVSLAAAIASLGADYELLYMDANGMNALFVRQDLARRARLGSYDVRWKHSAEMLSRRLWLDGFFCSPSAAQMMRTEAMTALKKGGRPIDNRALSVALMQLEFSDANATVRAAVEKDLRQWLSGIQDGTLARIPCSLRFAGKALDPLVD